MPLVLTQREAHFLKQTDSFVAKETGCASTGLQSSITGGTALEDRPTGLRQLFVKCSCMPPAGELFGLAVSCCSSGVLLCCRYQEIQSTKPQTLGYALNDSPVVRPLRTLSPEAASILYKPALVHAGISCLVCGEVPRILPCFTCAGGSQRLSEVSCAAGWTDGFESVVSKDELITNVLLYWCGATAHVHVAHTCSAADSQPLRRFTGSITSSMRLYYESMKQWPQLMLQHTNQVSAASPCRCFPSWLCSSDSWLSADAHSSQPLPQRAVRRRCAASQLLWTAAQAKWLCDGRYIWPKAWIEACNSDLRQWTEHEQGGHFAALEQPQALLEDILRFYKTIEL